MNVRDVQIPPECVKLMRMLMQLAETQHLFGVGKTGPQKKAWVLTALIDALARLPDERRPEWMPPRDATAECRDHMTSEALDLLGFVLEIVWKLLFQKDWFAQLNKSAD